MKNAEKYKTAQERLNAFHEFCKLSTGGSCVGCQISGDDECDCVPYRGLAFWLDLEALEEEKPLPCPFCGGNVIYDPINCDTGHLRCERCGCCSPNGSKDSITSEHNRIARAVMAAK